MIETKKGEITLEGSKAELIADLSVVVRGIKEVIMNRSETEESAKQQINEVVKVGLMNDEEFEKHKKEKNERSCKNIIWRIARRTFR